MTAGCGSAAPTPGAPEPTGVLAPMPTASPDQSTAPSGGPTAARAAIDPGASVYAMVTTPTRVCWAAADTSSKASVIGCASKLGGPTKVLVRGARAYPGLVASGETLFFSTEGEKTIKSVSASGGDPSTIVAGGGPTGRFALAGGTFFWIDFEAGSLMGSPLSPATGAPAVFAPSGGADSELLAADEYTVYDYPAVFAFAAGVVRLRPSGAASSQLSGACFYPMRLAAKAGRVFWSCEDNTFRWTSQSPGDTEHVTQDVLATDMATSLQGDAFVVDQTHNRVLRLRAGAASLETFRDELIGIAAVAVDSDAVFVADGAGVERFAL